MNVLITGASGFIGKHLLKEVASRYPDHHITAACRNTGDLGGLGFENVKIGKFDLFDEDHVILKQNYDVLFHLAWPAIHNYNSLDHLERILPAQIKFMKEASKKITNCTVTGTCFEYGLQEGELKEEAPALPITTYGKAKNQLRNYVYNNFNIEIKWLRLFYVYGPNQYQGSLIPQLEKAIEDGETSFNMSPGQQVRDYLHVDDLVRKIVNIGFKQGLSGVYNCSSGKPVKLESFVRNYLNQYHSDKQVNLVLGHYDYNQLEPFEFWGNNDKLNAVLNV